MKHTPGPWTIDWEYKTAINSGSKHIAMVNFYNCADPDQRITEEDNRANAALIAAAPDLLEVAKCMMKNHRGQLPSETADLYGGGCGCPLCEQARAAIAKAEGRE